MRYFVDDHGAKGPFGLDELTHMVRSGRVTASTPLVAEGDSSWQPAGTALPALFGRKRRWPILIGALGVTTLLVGVALVLFFLRPWSTGALLDDEFLRTALPSDVSTVSVSSINETPGAADDPQITASAHATLCGGTDVASRLLSADGKSLEALERDGILSLLSEAGLREGLLCGRSLAAGTNGSPVVMIHTPDTEHGFVLFRSPNASLARAREHSFSSLDGWCIPTSDDAATCEPELLALVNKPPWWAWGQSKTLTDFARDWVREDRSETSNMELARALLAAMQPGMSTRAFIKPDELDIFLRVACIQGAGLDRLSDCFPADVGDSIDRIETHSRGFGWQHGDVFDGEHHLRHIYYFISRDERDAEDVRTELDSLLRDWRAHLENNEPQIVQHIRESDNDRVDFDEAVFRAFMRAVRESELEVAGRIVTWAMDTELTESEQREVQRRLESLRTKHQAVSRILGAILVEEAPDRADLVLVVGESAADWMLMPRATSETCTAIRDHITDLIEAGVPTAEFGARFRQEERFGLGQCVGLPMPEAARSCILGARSFEAMEQCELPKIGALQ